MSLVLGDIEFGEIDAKHEVFAQARDQSYLLLNAFQMPPSVNFDRLRKGAKFFISGLKGTGKTSLMLYLQREIDISGGSSHIVLFKSKLTEPERQRIAPITDLTAFTDQDKISFAHDYKLNWLWFIITELTRLIKPEDVLEGKEQYNNLRAITGVDKTVANSMFSGLQLTKIKAVIETAMKAGPISASARAEIEAISAPKEEKFMHIVDMCERYLYAIRLLPGKFKALFFDELELFIGKLDQKERDIHLIRDLLYTVSRVNQGFGTKDVQFCVYASVRSEVMYEINRIDPEIARDVKDFGVAIDWHGTAKNPDQSLLDIVEAKIAQSEINILGQASEDIWNVYFDNRIDGKSAKQYVLDISMFKPRTIIILLSTIADKRPEASRVSTEIVNFTETAFSNEMWREVEEELRTSYDGQTVAAIKASFRGLPMRSTRKDLEQHIRFRSTKDDLIRRSLGTPESIQLLLEALYRVGAIGTQTVIWIEDQKRQRDSWVFRHNYEPQLRETIMFHSSLRKALQLT